MDLTLVFGTALLTLVLAGVVCGGGVLIVRTYRTWGKNRTALADLTEQIHGARQDLHDAVEGMKALPALVEGLKKIGESEISALTRLEDGLAKLSNPLINLTPDGEGVTYPSDAVMLREDRIVTLQRDKGFSRAEAEEAVKQAELYENYSKVLQARRA